MHVLYPPMASPRTRVGTDSDKTAPMAVNATAIPPPMPKKRRDRGTAPRNAPMRAMHRAKKRFPATLYPSRERKAVKPPAIPPPKPKTRRYRGTAPRNAPMRAMHSAKKRFPATMYRSRFPVRSARCPTGLRVTAWAAAGGCAPPRPPREPPRRDDGRGEENRRPEPPVRDRAAQPRPGRHPEIEGGRIPTVPIPQKGAGTALRGGTPREG